MPSAPSCSARPSPSFGCQPPMKPSSFPSGGAASAPAQAPDEAPPDEPADDEPAVVDVSATVAKDAAPPPAAASAAHVEEPRSRIFRMRPKKVANG